jgi:hypothetical protein
VHDILPNVHQIGMLGQLFVNDFGHVLAHWVHLIRTVGVFHSKREKEKFNLNNNKQINTNQ